MAVVLKTHSFQISGADLSFQRQIAAVIHPCSDVEVCVEQQAIILSDKFEQNFLGENLNNIFMSLSPIKAKCMVTSSRTG